MKKTIGIVLLVLALAAAGCGGGKGAAELAVNAAQTAFDATKDKAMQIAPDQAAAIQTAIDGAKASIEKGDYTAAMEAAKAIPDQVKTLADGLAAKQQELQASWEGMKDMPAAVEGFQTKVDQLAKMKKLPAGMDAAKLDAAKATLADVTTKWGEAQAAMTAGNWAEAVAKGGEVKTALTEGMNSLGLMLPAVLQ